jgi:hypothetical protein
LQAALTALTMAEVLLTQLPELYAPLLLKEGVVHAIETLAAAPLEAPNATPSRLETPDSAAAAADGSGSVSRRSTRGRSAAATATATPSASTPAAATTPAGNSAVLATPTLATPGATPGGSHSGQRAAAISAARAFKAAHLQEGNNAMRGETAGLLELRTLGAQLTGTDTAAHAPALASLLRLLAAKEGDSVSTFEFVGSGTAQALREFLAPDGADVATEVTRLRMLWNALCTAEKCDGAPLPALVQKLQVWRFIHDRGSPVPRYSCEYRWRDMNSPGAANISLSRRNTSVHS